MLESFSGVKYDVLSIMMLRETARKSLVGWKEKKWTIRKSYWVTQRCVNLQLLWPIWKIHFPCLYRTSVEVITASFLFRQSMLITLYELRKTIFAYSEGSSSEVYNFDCFLISRVFQWIHVPSMVTNPYINSFETAPHTAMKCSYWSVLAVRSEQMWQPSCPFRTP